MIEQQWGFELKVHNILATNETLNVFKSVEERKVSTKKVRSNAEFNKIADIHEMDEDNEIKARKPEKKLSGFREIENYLYNGYNGSVYKDFDPSDYDKALKGKIKWEDVKHIVIISVHNPKDIPYIQLLLKQRNLQAKIIHSGFIKECVIATPPQKWIKDSDPISSGNLISSTKSETTNIGSLGVVYMKTQGKDTSISEPYIITCGHGVSAFKDLYQPLPKYKQVATLQVFTITLSIKNLGRTHLCKQNV